MSTVSPCTVQAGAISPHHTGVEQGILGQPSHSRGYLGFTPHRTLLATHNPQKASWKASFQTLRLSVTSDQLSSEGATPLHEKPDCEKPILIKKTSVHAWVYDVHCIKIIYFIKWVMQGYLNLAILCTYSDLVFKNSIYLKLYRDSSIKPSERYP